jgi:hypothetical protein
MKIEKNRLRKNMKKMLLALVLLLTAQAQAQTKCNWSDYYMVKSYQRQNLFQFRTNLHYEDTCFSYTWLVYDYQLKRVDTLREFAGGVVEVQFNAKGKYKVGIHAVNKCAKHGMASCDTNFVYNVDITIYGKKAKMSYSAAPKNCRAYTFEMNNMNDTCMEYYYELWKADEWINKMSNKEWNSLSDSAIYFGYSWDEKNVEYYSTKSERVLKHEFSDSGRYIVYNYWRNKCSGIDTWAFTKITVCPTEPTTSVKTIVKNADLRIIGYYDMMGRQVEYMRSNEVYIVLYSNGQRRKVMQVQN